VIIRCNTAGRILSVKAGKTVTYGSFTIWIKYGTSVDQQKTTTTDNAPHTHIRQGLSNTTSKEFQDEYFYTDVIILKIEQSNDILQA
jgi:hypothetical protein